LKDQFAFSILQIASRDSKLENPNRELKEIKKIIASEREGRYDSKLENPNRELKARYYNFTTEFIDQDSKLENPNRELKGSERDTRSDVFMY